MKIRIIVPIVGDRFNREILKEASICKSPDTEIDVVNLEKGPESIESIYDEYGSELEVIRRVKEAEKEGAHGVFVDCFNEPGVEGARELVRIPVVGGFKPAALTASLISGRWSVVTTLQSTLTRIRNLSRELGIDKNIASIRWVDIPVLGLHDKGQLQERLLLQIERAVKEDGAEACVLGCTGMLGIAKALSKEMEARKRHVPVIDPTATAIGYLELLIRSKISQSPLTYLTPPEKERLY
jgi:allantoin racemase